MVSICLLSFFLCYFFSNTLVQSLLAPTLKQNEEVSQFLLLSPLEGFLIHLKVSFWCGLFLSAPLWLLPLFHFIAPALEPEEKALARPLLFCLSAATLSGLALAYFGLLPLATHFLFDSSKNLGQNLWSLGEVLDFTLTLLCSGVLLANLLMLFFFLVHKRYLSYSLLISYRKHGIIIALVLGALLTPPDVFSQLLLALPLYLGFEFIILYSKVLERR